MEYAILATLWDGPATMLERFEFIERRDPRSPYTIAERGSVYLANTAVTA
jgi:hypothetical protein